MTAATTIQRASSAPDLPTDRDLRAWVRAVLDRAGSARRGEITLRLVDEAEGAQLNRKYRRKPGATNVLSFPFEDPPGVASGILGDVVICAPVVAREAREQDKPPVAHWAHVVVHGVLHLLGYDHRHGAEAAVMESLERDVLDALGFPAPYSD